MDTLQTRLDEVAGELAFVGDWTDRYRLLVEWGEAAVSLTESECRPEYEVSGCSSPLWLRVVHDGTRLSVRGCSPGILPKALVAVVVRLFDGLETVEGSAGQIMERLELKRHLSPTRSLVLERMLTRALAQGGPVP